MFIQTGSSPSEVQEIGDFAEWLLDVGNGTAGGENDGEVDIQLPHDILIRNAADPIATIVDSTYPSLIHNMPDEQFFQDRAILAPTNEMVEIFFRIGQYSLKQMRWLRRLMIMCYR